MTVCSVRGWAQYLINSELLNWASASPEEIADLVAYAASPLSAATTGAALGVEAGITPIKA